MTKRWAAVAAAVSLSGCAITLQESVTPKARAGKEPVECSTSLIPRGLDVGFAVADAIVAGVFLGHYSHNAANTGIAIGAAALGAVHIGSILVGNDHAAECRRYKEAR